MIDKVKALPTDGFSIYAMMRRLKEMDEKLIMQGVGAKPNLWNFSLFSDGSGSLFAPGEAVALTSFHNVDEFFRLTGRLLDKAEENTIEEYTLIALNHEV